VLALGLKHAAVDHPDLFLSPEAKKIAVMAGDSLARVSSEILLPHGGKSGCIGSSGRIAS
jgi:hypothetical protein